MSDEFKKEFLEYARNVPDFYQDYDIALYAFSKKDGVAEEVLAFMKENPDAKSDEVFDFLDWAYINIKGGKALEE